MNKYCSPVIFTLIALLTFSSCKEESVPFGQVPGFPSTVYYRKGNRTGITIRSKSNIYWRLTSMAFQGHKIQDELWDTFPGLSYQSNIPKATDESLDHLAGIYKVQYNWFTWERLNDTSIKIVLKPNMTKKDRVLKFFLTGDTGQEMVKVVQKAD
ncbi:hypothetical protein [Sphingobacterium humi]|uniref:Lipoprotein n=1 Tax=Sphingobacterium humi TaxID=1796905 RepID=A0A6N8L347_9SPHI|nr:hypothetical protein [Sphingobacterium humi]MVZ64143.1 hypothetical protein [Sphingobacterium humi]